jgi:alpha-galactosidase
VDINPETLDLVTRLCKRLIEARGHGPKVEASTERKDVLPGADYVTATVSVGGDDAWQNDLQIPLRHGVLQPTGDTVGAGGFSRALRHVPVLVEIARDMERLCPQAILFNYSNPMTTLCRAVNRETRIQCFGLCVGAELIRRYLVSLCALPLHETAVHAAGINHCMWALGFQWKGRDAYPLVRAKIAEISGRDAGAFERELKRYGGLEKRPDQPFHGVQRFTHRLFEQFGLFPGPGDTHVAEFFPHLFRRPEDYEAFGLKLFNMQWKRQATAKFMDMARAVADGTLSPQEAKLADASGEEQQVVEIVRALQAGAPYTFHVNVPNRGYIPNLPAYACVEVPTYFDSFGAHPCTVGALPAPIAAVVSHWVHTQELYVDAALSGDRKAALTAYLSDLSCPSVAAGERICDELLAANKGWLPRFAS